MSEERKLSKSSLSSTATNSTSHKYVPLNGDHQAETCTPTSEQTMEAGYCSSELTSRLFNGSSPSSYISDLENSPLSRLTGHISDSPKTARLNEPSTTSVVDGVLGYACKSVIEESRGVVDGGDYSIYKAKKASDISSRILMEESLDDDEPRELRTACGVMGCVLAAGVSCDDVSVAQCIMDGLVALQHRGQESAGIVTSVGRGCTAFRHHRGLGLVTTVFPPDTLTTLTGVIGLGHTRYSTAGGGDLSHVQPFMVHTRHGLLAIAHNGELINADTLRNTVLERGVGLSTKSDSELITQILSLTPLRELKKPNWQARIRHLMEATPTSYSLALMYEDKIYGVRDPFGNRPLCLGVLRERDAEDIGSVDDKCKVLGYVLGSESCAFTAIGATFLREVMPGEIVELSPQGVRRLDLVARPHNSESLRTLSLEDEDDSDASSYSGSRTNTFLNDIENVPPAFCIFEYVYFARPDTYFEGQQVYSVRLRCGRRLAVEAAVDADIVSSVPESATPAARGFSMQSGIPYVEVLHKSRYVGRTFIQPGVSARKKSVAQKFAAIAENVRGLRVVLVDDSVVRGTTIKPIVKLIRAAGAKEVHFRVASPPIRHPCYMGINIPTRQELVANRHPADELASHFGVDTLQYLSLDGLVAAVREGVQGASSSEAIGHCTACLSGTYPVKPSEW